MQLDQELRYGFESSDVGTYREATWIRDRSSPGKRKWMVKRLWPFHPQTVDCAILSRLIDPASGRVTISLAGLNSFGTVAAGEFLTVAQYWNVAAAQLPRGWDRKYCQFILKTKVVRTTPGRSRMVAVHCW